MFYKRDEGDFTGCSAGADRVFYEKLKLHLKKSNQKSFYSKDLRMYLRESPSSVNRKILNLENYGYLQRIRGSKARGFEYQVIYMDDYIDLKDRVEGVLDGVLSKLKLKEANACSDLEKRDRLKKKAKSSKTIKLSRPI